MDIKEFRDQVKHINFITSTAHTAFHLKKAERDIFIDQIIKEYINIENPMLVGLQKNGCYAVFYRYGNDILRVILDMQINKIEIVTFYIIDKKQLPEIR